MTDSQSEFSFSSEGSEENSQTEESSSLDLRKLRKEEDEHLISMDKARNARSMQLA